jgi:hypothetical protein
MKGLSRRDFMTGTIATLISAKGFSVCGQAHDVNQSRPSTAADQLPVDQDARGAGAAGVPRDGAPASAGPGAALVANGVAGTGGGPLACLIVGDRPAEPTTGTGRSATLAAGDNPAVTSSRFSTTLDADEAPTTAVALPDPSRLISKSVFAGLHKEVVASEEVHHNLLERSLKGSGEPLFKIGR